MYETTKNEMYLLRDAVIQLEQVRVLFDALEETVFLKTQDNDAANAFYALEDIFKSKLSEISKTLP